MNKNEKPIGLTKDAGWQFGLRNTFQYSQEYVWDFLFSDKGLKIWFGVSAEALELKKSFTTEEGTKVSIKVLNPYSHIRMNWKKNNWENVSTLQIRVMGNQQKATISFHQDNLLDEKQREEMKLYWNEKLTEIEKALIASC